MGLLEVSFPGKVYNIFCGHFSFTVQGGLLNYECMLRTGIYETILSVVVEMDRAYSAAQTSAVKQLIQFRYSASTTCITITYMSYARCSTTVSFSKDLTAMLCFRANHLYWYKRASVRGVKSG